VDLLEPQVSFQHPRSRTRASEVNGTAWLGLKAETDSGYSTDYRSGILLA